jgi:cytochrome c biogenesis protein CcmG/thiol:disulfide interchange protein DsbE
VSLRLRLRPLGSAARECVLLKQTRSRATQCATLEGMRRALPLLAVAALVGLLVIGLTQAGGPTEPPQAAAFDLAKARAQLDGAPAPLAALHEQSNELLGGGTAAFERRLRDLRGHPVVVNKWASWCGPCRAEFPIFQRVATERGREIAFLGVNSRDERPAAQSFVERHPVPFPSYEDPDERIARAIGVPSNYPVTLFIDEKGETAFVHQGGYATAAQLAADIERHLG